MRKEGEKPLTHLMKRLQRLQQLRDATHTNAYDTQIARLRDEVRALNFDRELLLEPSARRNGSKTR